MSLDISLPSGILISIAERCARVDQNKIMNKNNLEIRDLERLFPWTYRDVAVACSVSLRTVNDWAKCRKIPFLKTGAVVRFNPDAVERALSKFVVREGGWR
jgi:excisionase family DNA binding protein